MHISSLQGWCFIRRGCSGNMFRKIAAVFFVCIFCFSLPWKDVSADTAFQAVDFNTVVSSIVSPASSLFVSDYTLSTRQAFSKTLVAYAQSGRPLFVVLSGSGFQYTIKQNCAMVSRLTSGNCSSTRHTGFWRRGNVAVYLTPYPMHAKMLMIGERAVVLTDENDAENGHYFIIPIPLSVSLMHAILHGQCESNPYVACDKIDALKAEASLIDTAKKSLVVSTESFSSGNPVYSAVIRAMHRGVRVHIIVAAREYNQIPRERATIARMQKAGASLSVSTSDHKYLDVDGVRRWVGSANASAGLDHQIEWGYSF